VAIAAADRDATFEEGSGMAWRRKPAAATPVTNVVPVGFIGACGCRGA
jgi:hypothetical protein